MEKVKSQKPKQENIEEILKELIQKIRNNFSYKAEKVGCEIHSEFDVWHPDGHKIISYELPEEQIKSFIAESYTAGRSSMRAEILAIVPQIKTERDKVWAAKCDFGIGEYMLGTAGEKIAWNACRSELLGKIGGIE